MLEYVKLVGVIGIQSWINAYMLHHNYSTVFMQIKCKTFYIGLLIVHLNVERDDPYQKIALKLKS